MSTTITHDEAASRFTIAVEGQEVGFAAYVRDGNVWNFNHTVVDPEFGGRGLAGQVVNHGLQTAIDSGGQILPTCPYVAKYISRHPEFAAHVVDGQGR